MLNRADTTSASAEADVERLLGRRPDVLVPSDRAIPRAITDGAADRRGRAALGRGEGVPRPGGELLRPRQRRCANGIGPEPAAAERRRTCGEREGDDGAPRAPSRSRARPIEPRRRRRDDPFADAEEPDPPRRWSASSGRGSSTSSDGDAVRERVEAEIRDAAPPGGGALARRPRTARVRDRRRHLRLRAARAAAAGRHDLGDHGQRRRTRSGSSAAACSRGRRFASPTSRTCGGSSRRWSARSAAASTSRRRWSTRACPTARA